jgi:tetratricopeptide (TPR) repeat protein
LNLARYNNALELIVSNEYETAIPDLVNYVNFFGNDMKTRKFLGYLYFKIGLSKLNPDIRDNFSEIRDQWFFKALSFDDDNLQILFYVSLFEIELKKFNEARTFLNKLISLDPSNYKYRYFLSLVNLENGNRKQALTELKELLAAESNNGLADYSRRAIANEYIKDSNFSEALTILEQLV